MKTTVLLFYTFLIFSPLLAQDSTTIIRNVTVIDVKDGSLLPEKTVVVKNNRIHSINSGEQVPYNFKFIDGEGKYLIPGLWDMHMHALQAKEVRDLYLAYGVTGLRELGGSLELVRLMDSLEKHNSIVPRSEVGVVINKHRLYPSTITANNPREVELKIDSLARKKVDFIKPYSGLEPEVYEALIKKCQDLNLPAAGHVPDRVPTKRAAELGQSSIEHSAIILKDCTPLAGTEQSMADYDKMYSMESGEERQKLLFPILDRELSTYNSEMARDIAITLATYNTAVTPTLVTMYKKWFSPLEKFHEDDALKYVPPALAESWHFENQPYTSEQWKIGQRQHKYNLDLVKILNEEGVLLLAGSDMGVPYIYPGYSLHEELQFLVEAGLSNLEALQTATLNPAIYYDREKELGTVEEGKLADLVLLNNNPLDDISNTLDIEAIWINGNFLEKEDLNRLKAEAIIGMQNMRPPEDEK